MNCSQCAVYGNHPAHNGKPVCVGCRRSELVLEQAELLRRMCYIEMELKELKEDVRRAKQGRL